MSVGKTAADLARQVFDYAMEKVIARARGEVPAYVTRADFEQAIIELRFEAMQLEMQFADMERAAHEARMAEIRRQADADRAAGNVPDVTIVERDGSEVFVSPWRGNRWRP